MREGNDLDRPDPDGLIDSALGTYAHADFGLEHRVLARIAAEPTPAPRFPRMIWAAALAAATCVLLLIFVLMHARPARAPESNARKTPAAEPAPKETARTNETAQANPQPVQRSGGVQRRQQARDSDRAEIKATTALAARLPRQEIFPTPRPLSPAERALVTFATRAPVTTRDSFVAAQQQADAPIAIADLRIAPIQIPPIDLTPTKPDTN